MERHWKGEHEDFKLFHVQSDDNDYSCFSCGKTLNSKLERDRHFNHFHSASSTFYCDICDTELAHGLLKSRYAILDHLYRIHNQVHWCIRPPKPGTEISNIGEALNLTENAARDRVSRVRLTFYQSFRQNLSCTMLPSTQLFPFPVPDDELRRQKRQIAKDIPTQYTYRKFLTSTSQ